MNKETLDTIRCLENAATYCRTQAAMAWGEVKREMWRKRAEWNEEKIEEIRKSGATS